MFRADLQSRVFSAGERRIAACRVVRRVPRTAGKRIRPCPPPSAYGRRLLLYFPDSLPRHPRLASTVPAQRRQQPRRRDAARVFCVGKHQRRPGRGWATGCGAYAALRSTGPMASVRSTPRELTSSRLSERSERSSRSELATRPWDRAPQGTPTEGRGAASEAADGGPPAAHARTRTQLTATGSKAPVADSKLRVIDCELVSGRCAPA